MIQVVKLGHAAFQTPDLDVNVAYYRDVMGFAVSEQNSGAAYLTSGIDHTTVALRRGDSSGLAHIALQLTPDTSLESVVRELKDVGARAELKHDAEPGIAALVELDDPEGNRLKLYVETDKGKPSSGNSGIRPNKLGHICVRTNDVPKLARWYQDVLGFQWADWMGDFFVFIRCGPDHHSLNFLKGPRAGNVLHHIAYELNDFAHVQPACDILARNDYRLIWGPGRHGPGHNIFTYHAGPDGHKVELFAQLDVIDQRLGQFEPRPWHEDNPQRPKVWKPGPSSANSWGVPPPDNFLE